MHTYDPQKHHRRSVRLKGYDYAQPGAYFVTICVRERECVLGRIVDGQMELNMYGRVAATMWQRLPRFYPHVELDAWVVMPNHVHGIIVIVDDVDRRGEAFQTVPLNTGGITESESPGLPTVMVGMPRPYSAGGGGIDVTKTAFVECPTPTATGEVTSRRADSRPTAPASSSLGIIVGNFKSVTTRRINRIRKSPGVPLWQRSFYDHIIRNERELRAIREYIIQNPLRWDLDRDNPDVIQINQGR